MEPIFYLAYIVSI